METITAPIEMDSLLQKLQGHRAALASTDSSANPAHSSNAQSTAGVQPVQGAAETARLLSEEEKKAEIKRLREKAAAKLKDKEKAEEVERETRRRNEGRDLLAARDRIEETQVKLQAEQKRKEKVPPSPLFLHSGLGFFLTLRKTRVSRKMTKISGVRSRSRLLETGRKRPERSRSLYQVQAFQGTHPAPPPHPLALDTFLP